MGFSGLEIDVGLEDEMVDEMAAGMKKIKGSGVREELAV